MATLEPIVEPNEKAGEPWKPPPRPGQPGIGYDELGAEMAPNARVWKKYVEETDRMDRELVEGWDKSLDIILIFELIHDLVVPKAALFSAISTAFVIESSKDLKPDYSQASAQTLQQMSQVLSAIAGGTPLNDSDATASETQEFAPSSSAIAVNALWFLSLGLSVAVSLIAILAKEWCHSFMAGRVGSMLRQARLRQQRWDGIERWKMKEILYVLPLLMHTALLLFAVGLSLYLWDINIRVALPVVVTTSLAALFYVVTVLLPLFFRFCPYTTALARFLYPYWLMLLGNRHTLNAIGSLVASLRWMHYAWVQTKRVMNRRFWTATQDPTRGDDLEATRDSQLDISSFSFRDAMEESHNPIQKWVESMRAMFSTDRSQLVEKNTPMDSVTCSMIAWMVVNCEDSRSVDMALQALAGADRPLPRLPLWECGAVDTLCQRIDDCVDALAGRSSIGLLAAHNTLLDDASLFSRSFNFLTTYIAGEGLDMTGEPKPCFAAKDDHELVTRLQNTAQRADYCVQYRLSEILEYAWNQRTPRYDLVAYELNTVPSQANEIMWSRKAYHHQQCQKQEELVRQIASRRVSGLPSGAVLALINGLTKTYLYIPWQSPKPLLDLLHFLEAENFLDSEYTVPLAVGFAVVGLLTGGYIGKDDKEDTTATNDTRINLAREAYNNLAARRPDLWQSRTLLYFGLLSMFYHKTNGAWTLDAAEVEQITSRLCHLQIMYYSYHSVLPDILPVTFDHGHHLMQVLSQLLHEVSSNEEFGPIPKPVPPTLLRIEAVLSHARYNPAGYPSRVVPLLTQHFLSTNLAELKKICLRGIKYKIEASTDQPDLVLDSLVKTGLLTQALEVTTSTRDDQTMVPYCMEFLWVAGERLLSQAGELNPEAYRPVARSLLQSLDNPFKTSSAEDGLPQSCDELGLANLWLPKIDEICRSNPQNTLDSDLISAMIDFYECEAHADIKPRTTELPSAFDNTWTWLQILRYWEKICHEAIINQAKDSALPDKETESIRTISSMGSVKRESESCVDMHD